MSHVLCLRHISYLYFYCIPVLFHLLLISIVLNTYAFLSCDHSMFHLVILVCLSYIHIIYDFHGYILYHLLCSISMYCYHILLSCIVIYCIHVLFHVLFSYILFSCYTFHITFSFILTFQIILHSDTFLYIMSDCIISCYRT